MMDIFYRISQPESVQIHIVLVMNSATIILSIKTWPFNLILLINILVWCFVL